MSAGAASSRSGDALGQLLGAASGLVEQLGGMVADQPLLQGALVAMALVALGSLMRPAMPLLGGVIRFFGNLGLMAMLVLGVLQVSGAGGAGTPVDQIRSLIPGLAPQQEISGKTTRIPQGPDGHFWVVAQVNGVKQRFLVDTGATITTLSPEAADKCDLRADPALQPVELRTANGAATGRRGRIEELRIGNVVARQVDAIIAPGIGDTNILGMNVLNRLASWRVEGRVMVLVPHHPSGPNIEQSLQ
jgi:aspartyl protease family protein